MPALLVALLAACGSVAEDASDLWTLARNLRAADEVELVVGHPELVSAATRAAERLRERGTAVTLVRGTESREGADVPRVALLVAGDPRLDALGAPIGLAAPADGGLALHGRPLGREAVVVATFEDPARPGLPVSLWASASPDDLALHVEAVEPTFRPGLRVLRGGELVLRAALTTGGAVVPGRLEDFDARRAASDASPETRLLADGVELAVADGVDLERARAYGQALARARARALALLDLPPDAAGPLAALAEAHPEDQLRLRGRVELGFVHPSRPRRVRALLADALPDDGGAAGARAALYDALGPPALPWLDEAVGTWIAGVWWGRHLADWVALLERAELGLSLRELLDPDAERDASAHRLGPLRATLVGLLAAERGEAELHALWTGERTLAPDPELERLWRARLAAIVEARDARLDALEGRLREAALAAPWGGVCIVPGGEDAEEAFLSRGLDASLDRALELGANAVSLPVLAFAEPREAAWPDAPRPGPVDAAVSDLALAHAAGAAHLRGMRVLLAPSLAATPSGTWLDGVGVGDLREVERFFALHARLVEHYGLLARLLGCEALSLGEELRAATRVEDERIGSEALLAVARAKGRGWQELLDRARAAYDGALTYGADHGGELERVPFWERLDAVGIVLFPRLPAPLSSPARRAAAIERALDLALETADEVDRPLWILQVGFPSSPAAADRPAVPGARVDLEEQRALYEALADALAALRAAGRAPHAVFLWRWDPRARAGGPRDAGMTPQGKPAEEVVPRILAR